MATPVPVVSMMYVFVFNPPKVFVIVRPAFEATSSKWGSGREPFGAAGLLSVCAVATRLEPIKARPRANRTRRAGQLCEVGTHATRFMSVKRVKMQPVRRADTRFCCFHLTPKLVDPQP